MSTLTDLAYLLAIPALLLGIVVGWNLRLRRERRRAAAAASQDTPLSVLDEKRRAVQDAEAEQAELETRLTQLTQMIASARLQLHEAEEEQRHVLLDLEGHENGLQGAQEPLRAAQEALDAQKARTEALLADVDASIEEYEMLSKVNETYAARIKRLTQETQRQDSELQMLRQTLKSTAAEIASTREQISQLDKERRELTLQLQQSEADVAQIRQRLAGLSEELRRLLDSQTRTSGFANEAPGRGQPRIDVTPPNRPRLGPGREPGNEASDDGNDPASR